MIYHLLLQNVGPAPKMELFFNNRFNVLTGDNGLGKTFLLDTIWWALTRSWANQPLRPSVEHGGASIHFVASGRRLQSGTGEWGAIDKEAFDDTFDVKSQRWNHVDKRIPFPGLLLYTRVDGGISIWDPAKHTGGWTTGPRFNEGKRQSAYNFSNGEIWDGKKIGKKPVCNGLIQDWVNWQHKESQEFQALSQLLEDLSPHDSERIEIAAPDRISIDDSREFPFITLPYGTIPITIASAGMRRIISMAYALVWAFSEHRMACEKMQTEQTRRVVFLMDEVEAHLHPQWQRVILPAIHRVCLSLLQQADAQVQVIATSHAPLVLASLETMFDENEDSIFVLEAKGRDVKVRPISWSKQGDTVGWLVSDSFGLQQARSIEAERAIEAAEAYMRGDIQSLPQELREPYVIHNELRRTLAGHDPFWARWIMERGQTR